LKWVDALRALLDLTSDDFRNHLADQLAERAALGLLLHDVHHLLPDLTHLRRSRICRLLDLIWTPLSERDAEETEKVIVGGLDDGVRLDESLPLADEGAKLVGGEVQAVEVGQAVLALHLIDSELHLAEGMVLIFLQIGERDFEDAAFEGVVGVLETSGPVHQSLADTVEPLAIIPRSSTTT
jgi:hypothetical protein